MPETSRLFCFGLGYTARALGRRLLGEGWQVAGTARSEASAESLRAEGFEVHPFDDEWPLADPAAALGAATHLLASVPPVGTGDPVLAWHRADILACTSLEWIGYLSTTGVYGDRQGGWVDEDSALEPTGERGRRRVEAERAWLALDGKATQGLAARGLAARGLAVQVFRLAGIYGPGRNALETVRAGKAQRIDKPGQVFSRIHVEDIATALAASMARPDPGRVYNLCDDEAAPPAEVIAYACTLLGLDPPPLVPFQEAALGPMARSFYRDSKRVSNRRMKEELGVVLRYPHYRAGLEALFLAAEGGC